MTNSPEPAGGTRIFELIYELKSDFSAFAARVGGAVERQGADITALQTKHVELEKRVSGLEEREKAWKERAAGARWVARSLWIGAAGAFGAIAWMAAHWSDAKSVTAIVVGH